MSLLTPDLTGTSVYCRVENDTRLIITDEQVVPFYTSIFADTIEMVLIGTANQILVKDKDWYIADTDIDYDTMGSMKLRDKTFNRTLVKSITMSKVYVADYKINMSYQKLYPKQSTLAIQDYPERVEFTPEIWYEVLNTVKRHELLLAPITDIHSEGVVKQPMLLEPDPNQQYNRNKIVDELYSINVPNKVQAIHPIHGAFFKDTLVIKRADTNELLKENEDYVVYGYDSYKTSNTLNTSGVFKYILFIKPYVLDVALSYHAYGGDPSLYDIKAHNESINNLTDYILNSQLLTADTVANAPVILNMISKFQSLEEQVRILSKQGRPNYGDATSGNTLLKTIYSPTPKEMHWWTIAQLYTVSGQNTENEVHISGTMKMNVEMLYKKIAFTAYVSVNLDNYSVDDDGNPYKVCDALKVTCPISQAPLGYEPFRNYYGLDTLSRPQFRIIWNNKDGEQSGIYLQIGMRLHDIQNETIAVEDISGLESCWKLMKSTKEVSGPEDDFLYLPSGSHIWSTDNQYSNHETYLIPLVDGNIIWNGSVPLNRPNSGRKDITLEHFLEDEVDISRIRRIRFDLEEVGHINFPVYIDMIPGTQDLIGSTSFTYNGKSALFTGRIRRNPSTNEIELSIGADITAGLASTQLNLRHVIIYT